MASAAWSEELSVGVMEIDLQHQNLVALLGDVDEALRLKKSAVLLHAALAALHKGAREHFATEDGYFERFEHAGNDRHRREHRKLLDRLTDLQGRLAGRRGQLTMEDVASIGDWLLTHVVATDKPYFEFLKEQGWV